MTQATPIITANQPGATYRGLDNDGKQALLNHHKGASAPSYAEAGTIWLDDTSTPWSLKMYDGADWIVFAKFNATTNAVELFHGTASLRVLNHATDTGSANAYAVAPVPAITAYATGQIVILKPANANTGSSTVAVSGLSTVTIKMPNGSNLPAGALITTHAAILMHDGTNFLYMNPPEYLQGTAVASATTTNLDTATGDFIHITGTTAITGITLSQGVERTVVFDGTLTLTNGASLINISAANITTAAGDTATFRGEASGVVRMISYTRASGNALSYSTILATANSFTKAQRGTPVSLTQAATIAVDLSLGNHFYTTMTGNGTLGQPTNMVAGQSGTIEIIQDATGSRTLAYHADWLFPNGTDPVLTTTASATDILCYQVNQAGTKVFANLLKAFA